MVRSEGLCHHRETNPRLYGLWRSASINCTTAYPQSLTLLLFKSAVCASHKITLKSSLESTQQARRILRHYPGSCMVGRRGRRQISEQPMYWLGLEPGTSPVSHEATYLQCDFYYYYYYYYYHHHHHHRYHLLYETLFPNCQKESCQTSEETSRYVRPEGYNKWPNSMTDV